ncbi:unnamed protein product [Spirodela intermedia]|uniref:SGNH hydrolase-type esterase domain-containing protein n=1 Tax=Spirodela intermedia TaxID=51605 RepID=A0A7I8JSC1_SPIIN|nr:unnamed protein product [Spirodela intermedia]CAA6673076.1 unnamed protein product [Spirodela intermedia]
MQKAVIFVVWLSVLLWLWLHGGEPGRRRRVVPPRWAPRDPWEPAADRPVRGLDHGAVVQAGGWGAALATFTPARSAPLTFILFLMFILLHQADITIRGYGGYNTRWALHLLGHIFPPPVAVTIFFGANDAALLGRNSHRQHVPLKEYKDNLRLIVQHLKESSPTILIVLITPPLLTRMEGWNLPERTNEVTGLYAKECINLAAELQIPCINLWSKMQETEGWQKKFLSDGLHLTEEGNGAVFREVVRVFSEAGLNADSMPYDFPHHSVISGDNPEQAFL